MTRTPPARGRLRPAPHAGQNPAALAPLACRSSWMVVMYIHTHIDSGLAVKLPGLRTGSFTTLIE
jgi:hypothetical protein